MKITVNGRIEDVDTGMTVAALVATKELPGRGVAIALNLEVVRAEAWSSTALAANDVVDIVTARQGG